MNNLSDSKSDQEIEEILNKMDLIHRRLINHRIEVYDMLESLVYIAYAIAGCLTVSTLAVLVILLKTLGVI